MTESNGKIKKGNENTINLRETVVKIKAVREMTWKGNSCERKGSEKNQSLSCWKTRTTSVNK